MRPDAPVLGFDTSAAHCAAALLLGNRVLASRVEPMAKGQAERLMPMLEEMLAGAGLGWRDLGGIGVGTGPGNFTGVRISVAAARGLALALAIPAVGVTVLEAAAFGLPQPLLAALDARRGQVYLQLFTPEGAQEPALAAPEALPAWAFEAQVLAGDASAALAALFRGRTLAVQPVPVAEAVARIAAGRIASGTPLPRPAPLYLRPADAALPREGAPEILP